MIWIKLGSFSNLIDIKGVLNICDFLLLGNTSHGQIFQYFFSKTELTEPPWITLLPCDSF